MLYVLEIEILSSGRASRFFSRFERQETSGWWWLGEGPIHGHVCYWSKVLKIDSVTNQVFYKNKNIHGQLSHFLYECWIFLHDVNRKFQ